MVVLMAGSLQYPGAGLLAAEGALRGGCGLVRAYAPGVLRELFLSRYPELLFIAESDDDEGEETQALSEDDWQRILFRARALALGPGLGTGLRSVSLVDQVLERVSLPLVLDADALTILSQFPRWNDRTGPHCVLSPHPSELARLLGRGVEWIQDHRWEAAREAAIQARSVVVLKGRGTLVATPSGQVTLVPFGNTAWSRGGSGDILCGLVGSLLAQGLSPEEASLLAVLVHGLASELALDPEGNGLRVIQPLLKRCLGGWNRVGSLGDGWKDRCSERGLRVTEVAAWIPRAFGLLENLHLES
jgi:NAD(P)H-hydrate epimerase